VSIDVDGASLCRIWAVSDTGSDEEGQWRYRAWAGQMEKKG
jgi:hypothetical protein